MKKVNASLYNVEGTTLKFEKELNSIREQQSETNKKVVNFNEKLRG